MSYYEIAKDLVQQLYDKPELGGVEYEAQALYREILQDQGFDYEEGLAMETDFVASYGDATTGPVISLCSEYDALPDIGHGCAHNLFGGISLLAALELKAVVDEHGGQIRLIGTPGEENLGGKIHLVDQGAFDDVDASLMLHPSTKNGLGSATQAIYPLKFHFHGKTAHGCKPQEGASALDAAVLTYTSIQFQRQFMEKGTHIHGVMKDGGSAANVIPDYASLEYYFRATTMETAKAMADEATKRAEAAATSCGCTVEFEVYECPYGETKLNEPLSNMLKEAFESLGRTEIEPIDYVPSGSSDVGAVSFKCPTVHGSIKIADANVTGHSREMAAATISPEGNKALREGADALVQIASTLLTDPAKLAECKAAME